MATKTETLRAALIARGCTVVDSRSLRECLKGKTSDGLDLYMWPDKTGGLRWCLHNTKTNAVAAKRITVELILAGKPSRLLAGGKE